MGGQDANIVVPYHGSFNTFDVQTDVITPYLLVYVLPPI